MRIMNTFDGMHSNCISLNGAPPLTRGEIHLIECIGKHSDANISELASILGNTRGAVSQMAGKLEKKQLITKTKRADNNKEVVLALLPDGQQVFQEHEKLHADLYSEIARLTDRSDDENLAYLKEILDIVEKYVKGYKEIYY